MPRIALALALAAAACGGSSKHAATAGSGSGSAIYAKKLAVSWGISPHGQAGEDVFLETTDDAGNQVSYPLGTYPGVCRVIKPAPAMKAATAVACSKGDSGTELDLVVEREQVVVLKLATHSGQTPDPMAREEVQRVTVPIGTAIVVGA